MAAKCTARTHLVPDDLAGDDLSDVVEHAEDIGFVARRVEVAYPKCA